jgi:phosphatidylglycerophosphate synthase
MAEYLAENFITLFRFGVVLIIYFLMLNYRDDLIYQEYLNFVYEKGSREEIKEEQKEEKKFKRIIGLCYFGMFICMLGFLYLLVQNVVYHVPITF